MWALNLQFFTMRADLFGPMLKGGLIVTVYSPASLLGPRGPNAKQNTELTRLWEGMSRDMSWEVVDQSFLDVIRYTSILWSKRVALWNVLISKLWKEALEPGVRRGEAETVRLAAEWRWMRAEDVEGQWEAYMAGAPPEGMAVAPVGTSENCASTSTRPGRSTCS